MQATQQPSVKNLLLSCLVGCMLIVVAAVGLYLYSEQQQETARITEQKPVSVAAPQALVMLTKTDKADAFAKNISGIHESVENFDVDNHTADMAGLDKALKTFDSWADFMGQGIEMNLSAEASAELEALFGTIQTVQQESLPVLRDQYGPLVRAEFAKIKAAKSAMTVGKGFKELVFTSADFKDKAAVVQFHAENLERFVNLRFEKITYRQRKWDNKPTINIVDATADNLLIDWTSNTIAGAIGIEHVFTASNHRAAAPTITADAETAQ